MEARYGPEPRAVLPDPGVFDVRRRIGSVVPERGPKLPAVLAGLTGTPGGVGQRRRGDE
ncbi:hypothetical protein ABN034_32005 [Actinopolymorpha sp. B11F2]|uniref:hypothetical protein n=1 Tax=Actinopolymorpha sp. B11F2 TaxID=3160862 RepID=UPI0032E49EEF